MNRPIIRLLTILILTALTLQAGSEYNYSAKTRLYFYGLASFKHFFSPDDYYAFYITDSGADKICPVLGAGFSLFNFGNKIFLNLDLDYARGNFKFRPEDNRKIEYLTFMIQGEFRINKKSPFSVYGGMGIGLVSVSLGADNDTEGTLALEGGIKLPLSRKLMFRSFIRFYLIPGYNYDYYYWDDYYQDNGELITISLSLGLEFHI